MWSGLDNCIACNKFAIQTHLWSVEMPVVKNFEHSSIQVSAYKFIFWDESVSKHKKVKPLKYTRSMITQFT